MNLIVAFNAIAVHAQVLIQVGIAVRVQDRALLVSDLDTDTLEVAYDRTTRF